MQRFAQLLAVLLLLASPSLIRAQEPGGDMQHDEMDKSKGEMQPDEKDESGGAMRQGEKEKSGGEMRQGEMAEKDAMAHEAMAKLPTVVKIHADWCPKCQAIASTWKRVENELGDDARVVELDVTNEAKLAASWKKAQELGLAAFFESYRSKTGTVAVFQPGSTSPSKLLVAEKDFDKYEKAVGEASAAS